MSRFGKNLVMVGIWAGIGILIGMQFGDIGEARVPRTLPDRQVSEVASGMTSTQGQAAAQVAPNSTAQGGPNYIYVPVAIDPATGAYTPVPMQQPQVNAPDSGAVSLPQQAEIYSTMTPEQILVPEEQKPTVDVLADKTAGLLQQASQKSIRWVVSLFGSAE